MWEGWTNSERKAIVKEVYLDRHGMVSFHKKVLNSQFFWWSLVPVLGCATAAMRWKAMSESKRKYDSWAHASHMALTQHSVIVVGIPTEEHRGQLPAQAWPRESISLESILDIHVDTRPSRVCCVRNTVKTVRLKLSAHSTPMQLVGILDPKQFIEDVFAIQSGSWPFTSKQLANEKDRLLPEGETLQQAPATQTHTNCLFDSTNQDELPAEPSVVTADAEISLAEHLNSTQHGTSTNTTQTPACSHKPIGIASSCETVQVSSDISAFHGLNEPGELQSELSSSGKAAHSQSKASRQHHETPEHQPGHTNATKDDAEDGLNGTWCWEHQKKESCGSLLPMRNRSTRMMLQLDSLDDSIEGWEPPTYEELHQVEYPPDVQKMVEESKGKITSDGIDLGKDIQAYDADSDGVCELASETAEWWGPEWETDEEDPRLDSMTPSEAEAVLLGSRLPPPTEEEIANLPGAAEAWKKFPECQPKARAVCEARLNAAQELERALGNAFHEAQRVKTHPLVSEQVPGILQVLREISNTVEQISEASGRTTRRQSGRFSGRMSLDPQAILARYI